MRIVLKGAPEKGKVGMLLFIYLHRQIDIEEKGGGLNKY